MDNYWTGKLALITGASAGIGANIAKYLATRGIRVILVARTQDKLENVASSIFKNGGIAYIYKADLARETARSALAEKIIADLGVPDILINNAGMGWYGYFSKMPWGVARNIIELNISSSTHLASLFLPHMLSLQKSRIINIGSVAGKLPEQGIALYSASKAYMDAFTKSVYRELRGTNMAVSVLRAGPVKTEFFNRALDLPAGGQIPGKFFAIHPERISEGVWKLIQRPKRYLYVPFYLYISPLLETLFSWLLDLVGPVLLRSSEKQNNLAK
jgi:short-subunit dehydrogenase